MDDREIEALEKALSELPADEIHMVEPGLTIADFCVDSIKELMQEGQKSPHKRFHVLHAGSVYYIEMVVKAIAPPYEAREPGQDKRQWFGQRET